MLRYMRKRLNDGSYIVGYVKPLIEEFVPEFSCFNEENAKAACDMCNFQQFDNAVEIGAITVFH